LKLDRNRLSWTGPNSADFGLAVSRLQAWSCDELEQDLGRLPAEMLLEVIAREVGPAFYNRGLYDAQVVLAARIEDVNEAIHGLEKKGGGR
jgi:uncharacterized protein (DUF2164 family)